MSAPPSAPVFAALGDATRLSIVRRLADAPALTMALAEETSLSRQAVRKHLDVLVRVGLVRGERAGRHQRWSLDARPIRAVRDWADGYRQLWESRLDRLERHLREHDTP